MTMYIIIEFKNWRYFYFGRVEAIAQDIGSFITARVAGLLLVLAGYCLKLDGRNAWRIFCRGRFNHFSPNSAQTEAACAGALHLQLGGDAEYFGEPVFRPTLGDDDRLPGPDDIGWASRLLYESSFICLLIGLAVKGAILCR